MKASFNAVSSSWITVDLPYVSWIQSIKRGATMLTRSIAIFVIYFLVFASTFVANGTAQPASNILLDGDKLRSMSVEEYAAAVQNAPDVNARDEDGATALHFAAAYGTPEKIAALLNAGADINARDEHGETALHFVAIFGTPEDIAALVNAGADLNARSDTGRTALHLVARFGKPETIAVLLNAGASGSIKDIGGRTPFDLATDNSVVKGTDVYWLLNDLQYK